MRPRARLTLFAVCCAALVGGVAGCGDDEAESGSSGSASAESPGGSLPDLTGQQMVFVNYGGEAAEAAKVAWVDPFAQETGAQMAMDAPSDPAKVKAMVEAGRTTWDVIDIDTSSGGSGCGTLYEKRGPDIDISKIDPKYVSDDCGVPIMIQSVALVYNKSAFGDNPPTKLSDFMDTERFPGKRMTFNYPVGTLEPLLLADGVAGEDLYPLDLDRAEQAIDELGNDLTFSSTLAQQGEALVSGDFALCLCYTGRAAIAADRGADIGVVWDRHFEGWDGLYAIKGSRSPEGQRAFLNYVATPEAQAAFTEQLPYGPTTPSARPELKPGWEEFVPAGKEDEGGEAVLYDADWWTKNSDRAFAAWTEMTAG